MDTPEWKKRLAHEKAKRDADVACGNELSSSEPDPPNSFIPVKNVLKFTASVWWSVMRDLGHSAAAFDDCQCKRLKKE